MQRDVRRSVDLSRLRSPRVLVAILAAAVVVLGGLTFLFLRGGDDGGTDAAPTPVEVPKTTDPCELWSVDDLQEWLGGSPWEKDEELSSGPGCVYREVDGPGTVSVLLHDASNQVLFDTLRSGREAAPVDGLGDEAWWWEDVARPGGGLVMRVGGRGATIDLGGQFDDRLAYAVAGRTPPDPDEEPVESEEDLVPSLSAQEISVEIHRRLVSLGTAVEARLEPTEFDSGVTDDLTPGVAPGVVTVGEAICATLSLDAMSADMEASTEEAALNPMGERGCTYSNADGVNVTVELVAKNVDESALEVGREMTIEGETLVWEPEPVAGVGDGAVWMVDPTTGTTGELNALFGGALVRVTSSASEAEGLKERAAAAARLAGPAVAELDEGDR